MVGGGDRGAESCRIKESVVGMVVTDGDTVLDRAKAFESLFGSDSCLLIQFSHEMDVGEIGEMVNEDCSAGVASQSRGTAVSGHESGGGTDQLVDANNLAWKSCRFYGTEVADTLGTPRFAVRFAVCATGTKGRRNVGKFMGNDVSAGKKLKLGEAEVA